METGLKINKDKTLAMIQTRSKACKANTDQQLHAGEHSINIVDSFHYLRSCITNDNNDAAKIQRRLKLANSAYYSISSIMKCRDVHKGTKIMLYKTLIQTGLTYGCETWRLSKQSEKTIGIIERKILRRIFGAVKDEGQWRMRYNKELYELYKDVDLVTFIKLKRLQWAGHVQRLTLDRIPEKALRAKFTGSRPAGKPARRWEDGVKVDAASTLRCRDWRLTAQNRSVGSEVGGGHGPTLGCSAIRWMDEIYLTYPLGGHGPPVQTAEP
jgi:hypothetical protein